jgi:N-acetylneuraminic acid mutarotase
MRTRFMIISRLLFGLLSSACGLSQPKLTTVEVTRIVPKTQIVTVEVTRVVPATQIVTAEVTRIVPATQIVTAEVTRIVRETVIVTPATPPSELMVNVTQGEPLQIPRAYHTATRLPDGRILLVGGSRGPDEFLTEVEIFDPTNNQITLAAPLNTPRHDHSATLLMDGRVLVVGGYNPSRWLDDAEVYDPSADTWTVVAPLHSHGVQHTATRMEDGRVLVVGGCIGSGVCTERAEIFNPQNDSWIEAASLESDRASHTALLLDTGRVLVAGGGSSSGTPVGGDGLLYDANLDAWTVTGPMINPRVQAQSIRLPDGRVLVAGGMTLKDAQALKMSASAEIYDPASNSWTAAASLSQPRYAFILSSLPDGQVLAIGGARDHGNYWDESSFITEIESYDPMADRWRVVGALQQPAAYATATLLPDGRLWLTGGRSSTSFWSDTWLIVPEPSTP